MDLFAVTLYSRDPSTGRVLLHAMPVMVVVLCCLAIAYRYYSAFLAAKVAALDAAGIAVTKRVPHQLPDNPHNARYLATKRDRAGHLLL